MCRALVLPFFLAALAPLAMSYEYGVPGWFVSTMVALLFTGGAIASFDTYAYRQKLLISTAVDHFLVAQDTTMHASAGASSRSRPTPHENVVAADWGNENPYPFDFARAHAAGVPHRAVHVEVSNGKGQLLVWMRADGRLELPGGHNQWVNGKPELAEQAAARELLEELGVEREKIERKCAELAQCLTPVAVELNRSDRAHNYEWVTIFAVDWDVLGLPLPTSHSQLSAEGNRDPKWLRIGDIQAQAELGPSHLNSSLLMLLGRRVQQRMRASSEQVSVGTQRHPAPAGSPPETVQ